MSLMSCNLLQILMHCSVSVLLWCPGNHQGHDAMMQAATTTPAKTWMFIVCQMYAMRCWTSRSLEMHRSLQVHAACPRLKPMWWPGGFGVSTQRPQRNLPTLGIMTSKEPSQLPLIQSRFSFLRFFSDAFKTWWQIKCMFFIFLVVWDLMSAQGASQIVQVTIFPCFNGPVKKECIHPASISKCSLTLGWCLAFGLKFLDNSVDIGEQLLKKRMIKWQCHDQDLKTIHNHHPLTLAPPPSPYQANRQPQPAQVWILWVIAVVFEANLTACTGQHKPVAIAPVHAPVPGRGTPTNLSASCCRFTQSLRHVAGGASRTQHA